MRNGKSSVELIIKDNELERADLWDEAEVVIPDGVTKIGWDAFGG
jgi:hypothetical protein